MSECDEETLLNKNSSLRKKIIKKRQFKRDVWINEWDGGGEEKEGGGKLRWEYNAYSELQNRKLYRFYYNKRNIVK